MTEVVAGFYHAPTCLESSLEVPVPIAEVAEGNTHLFD